MPIEPLVFPRGGIALIDANWVTVAIKNGVVYQESQSNRRVVLKPFANSDTVDYGWLSSGEFSDQDKTARAEAKKSF